MGYLSQGRGHGTLFVGTLYLPPAGPHPLAGIAGGRDLLTASLVSGVETAKTAIALNPTIGPQSRSIDSYFTSSFAKKVYQSADVSDCN